MEDKKICNDDVADAIINLNENLGLCDKETAIGFRSSKKKDILKSSRECSFSEFTKEINKKQSKKD